MDKEIKPYYQFKGKEIVDKLFEGKMFHDRLTRDDLNNLEDLLAWIFQTEAESLKRTLELINMIDLREKDDLRN